MKSWTENFRKGQDVAFLDYEKAFDKVSHAKIIHKLQGYGIEGNLLGWFKDYFQGRLQRVSVGNSYSDYYEITSSILQGSCLGPVLFSVFINDVVSVIPDGVQAFLFADDLQVFSSCSADLQKALSAIHSWSSLWQLRLSPSKCTVMHIGAGPLPQCQLYWLDGQILIHQSPTRNLGVLVSSSLSFEPHIKRQIKLANVAVSNVLKCFTSRRPRTMSKAFSVYVRPLLETFSPVWSPSKKALSDSLERVQRLFTRMVYHKCLIYPIPNYDERLKFLELEPLLSRRDKLDLCFAHKMYHVDQSSFLACLMPHQEQPRELRPTHRILIPVKPSTIDLIHFPCRVSTKWNSLAPELVNLSLMCFKNRLSHL